MLFMFEINKPALSLTLTDEISTLRLVQAFRLSHSVIPSILPESSAP